MFKESKKKILVAEDERPMAKALQLKLSNEGYQVSNAYDGQEVLDILSKEKYDLLLLDIVMPKKNGFEVLEGLKDLRDNIPHILMLSNLGQEEDSKKARSLGADDFIIKSSTSIDEIEEKVREKLR